MNKYTVECVGCLADIPELDAVEVEEISTGEKIYFCDLCWELAEVEYMNETLYRVSQPFFDYLSHRLGF